MDVRTNSNFASVACEMPVDISLTVSQERRSRYFKKSLGQSSKTLQKYSEVINDRVVKTSQQNFVFLPSLEAKFTREKKFSSHNIGKAFKKERNS